MSRLALCCNATAAKLRGRQPFDPDLKSYRGSRPQQCRVGYEPRHQQGRMTMAARVPQNFRRVITAAAGGNVIEWYDFYIFGILAAVLSVKFFEKSHPVAALLSTIALFTAGFLIRPLGAFLFGWMGD